jgi:thioredoxin reductase (NADPH)
VQKNEEVSFIWDTAIEEVVGNGAVEAVALKNLKTGAQEKLATDGVFIYIGHYPNTWLFKDQLKMDDHNYLITDNVMMTSVPGVFAAGEVQDPVFRQVVSSAGQGCQAAISAERWMASQGLD